MCFTEDEIGRFVKTDRKWLRPDYEIFFLVKRNDVFLVTCVRLGAKAVSLPFGHPHIWRVQGRCRLMVPMVAIREELLS